MSDLYAEALSTFAGLFEEAKQSREVEPNAMTVATADTHGRPSARTVLLKAFDERGFVFYTHLDSHKGRELQANPQAALLFLWRSLRDQRHAFFTDAAAQGLDLWRASVPQTAPVLAAAGLAAPLIEWHGAQRWYAVPPGGAAELTEAVRAAGGWAAAFRPAAGRRAEPASLPPALMDIHRALKAAFDPAGIFNPGRLVAGL